MSKLRLIDKIDSVLGKQQAKQFYKEIRTKIESGEIITDNDYATRLAQLTDRLKSDIKPYFKPYYAANSNLIKVAAFNEMMLKLGYDLQTLFLEMDTLLQLNVTHDQIIDTMILKGMWNSINSLENKIQIYKTIYGSDYNYSNAQYNTFNGGENLESSFSDTYANMLYYDWRARTFFSDKNLCYTDLTNDRLLLASTTKQVFAKNVYQEWSEGDATVSDFDVNFDKSDIRNLIDNQNATFFNRAYLMDTQLADGAIMYLVFEVPQSDINHIIVEPAGSCPFYLTSVDYAGPDGSWVNLVNDETYLQNSYHRIDFTTTNTRKFRLKFVQTTVAGVTEFYYDRYRSLMGQGGYTLTDINGMVANVLQTSQIADEINFSTGTTYTYVSKKNVYPFSLDNVKFGLSNYKHVGIFAGASLSGKLGQIALRVNDDVPADTFNINAGSIEYSILKVNYNSDGDVISSNLIPILPVGRTTVEHEVCVLDNKSRTALRFYPLLTAAPPADPGDEVKVYANGSELTFSTDWTFPDDNDISSPGAGSPMRVEIKINSPQYGVVYTASYTPKISDGAAKYNAAYAVSDDPYMVVDMVGDQSVRMITDHLICDDSTLGIDIDHSDIFLQVIIRKISPDKYISPSVYDYYLLVSEYNEDKFSEA